MQFVSVCESVCLCVCVSVCLCVCVSVSQTHRHTDTQKHRHTDSQTDTNCITINNKFLLVYGQSKILRKKLYAKTLFAPNFVLAMVVSERVFERQLQGLFKSGPKNCTYNLTIGANYAQMYLKIHHFYL